MGRSKVKTSWSKRYTEWDGREEERKTKIKTRIRQNWISIKANGIVNERYRKQKDISIGSRISRILKQTNGNNKR